MFGCQSMDDKKLEGLLNAAGNKLLEPSDSVDELLNLLDKLEDLLIRVDQLPSDTMKIALLPCSKGLIAKDLLTHSDADVKAAVAVCISEITRVTAPDSPYDESIMKEVFQLIVSTFERLWDSGSRSYYKRISILETVAKVRSCVMMLDMECDTLVVEMFQHFVKNIRENHPDNVFSSMETIMTLVFEESEEISLELLSPVVATVRKNDEERHPTIAKKLVERVLTNCGSKLKPYIVQYLEDLNHSTADYSSVVARVCEKTSGADEGNDASSRAEPSLHKETAAGLASSGEAHASASDSSKSVMNNGVKEAPLGDAAAASEVPKKPDESSNSNRRERRVVIKLSERTAKERQATPDGLDVSKLETPMPNSVNKKEQTSMQRGRKSSDLKKSVEPKLSEQGPTDVERQSNEIHDSGKGKQNDAGSSHQVDESTDAAPPVKESENAVQPSSLRKLESDSVNVHSSANDGSFIRKGGRDRKKSYAALQATPSAEVAKTKIPEETADADVKADKTSGKKVKARKDLEKKQKGEKSNRGNDGENSNVDEKESTVLKSGAKSTKDKGRSGKKNSGIKKMHPGKEETADSVEYGEEVVGSRIKVWWPLDKTYYEGVIESFDRIKKKHKVLYCDGDVEILSLKMERWDFLKSDSDEEAGLGGGNDSVSKHQKEKLNSSSSTKKRKVEAASMRGSGSSKKLKASAKTTATVTEDHAEVDGCKTISEADAKKDGKSKDGDLKKGGKKMDPETAKHKSKPEQEKLKVTSKGGGESSKTDGKSKSKRTATVTEDHAEVDGCKTISEADAKKDGKLKDGDLKKGAKKMDPETPKHKSKPEQEKLKVTAKGGGESSKTDGKSKSYGTGKLKSKSSKPKEKETVREESPELLVEIAKRKSSESSKMKQSEAKSAKKMRKEVN